MTQRAESSISVKKITQHFLECKFYNMIAFNYMSKKKESLQSVMNYFQTVWHRPDMLIFSVCQIHNSLMSQTRSKSFKKYSICYNTTLLQVKGSFLMTHSLKYELIVWTCCSVGSVNGIVLQKANYRRPLKCSINGSLWSCSVTCYAKHSSRHRSYFHASTKTSITWYKEDPALFTCLPHSLATTPVTASTAGKSLTHYLCFSVGLKAEVYIFFDVKQLYPIETSISKPFVGRFPSLWLWQTLLSSPARQHWLNQ